MMDAAARYADFVRETPEESAWLAEWNATDLVTTPRRKRR
jgi:hypothetical protein